MSGGPDIVIAGSGVRAATLAAALAPTRKRIVILEGGERLAESVSGNPALTIAAQARGVTGQIARKDNAA
jgi:choline dehydrogenase-like flavoprotein